MVTLVKPLPTPHLVNFEEEYIAANPAATSVPMATPDEVELLGLVYYIAGPKPSFDPMTQYLELGSVVAYDTLLSSYVVAYVVITPTGPALDELTNDIATAHSIAISRMGPLNLIDRLATALTGGINVASGVITTTTTNAMVFIMAPVPASPSAGGTWTITIPSHSHIISVQGVLEKQVGGDIVPIGGNSADGQGVGWTINGTTLTLDDEVIDTKASGYIAVTYIP